jgi:hypothetical protein
MCRLIGLQHAQQDLDADEVMLWYWDRLERSDDHDHPVICRDENAVVSTITPSSSSKRKSPTHGQPAVHMQQPRLMPAWNPGTHVPPTPSMYSAPPAPSMYSAPPAPFQQPQYQQQKQQQQQLPPHLPLSNMSSLHAMMDSPVVSVAGGLGYTSQMVPDLVVLEPAMTTEMRLDVQLRDLYWQWSPVSRRNSSSGSPGGNM